MSLDKIAEKYGTDKRMSVHGYTEFYERILGPLRDRSIQLMELGVKLGSSICMWEEYLPQATVIGVDRALSQMKHFPQRAKLIEAMIDANSLKAIAKKHGPFDVVIDDSAHTIPVCKTIVETLWPAHIVSGGWLIVEDVNSGYKRDLKEHEKHDLVGWCGNFIRNVNHSGNLRKCGEAWWDRSSEFDKAIKQIVLVPGIMALQRR